MRRHTHRLLTAFLSASAAALAASMPMDRAIPLDIPVSVITFVDGGKVLAAFGEDGQLRLVDLKSGTSRIAQDATKVARRRMVSIVPGSDQFAAIDESGGVRILDTKANANRKDLPPITPKAGSLTASRGGAFIATTHMPDRQTSVNVMKVRDTATGRELFSAPAGLGGVSAMTFSPDGSTVVAASYDADVRVWTVRNGELVKVIDSLPVTMFAMEFSPDGKWLAAAGVDRTIYLWNAKTWALERKITGQPELISALAFSPDGRRLATGGFDSAAEANPVKLIIWDLATSKPVRTETMPHAVVGVAWSPDGKQLAAISLKGSDIRLWQTTD